MSDEEKYTDLDYCYHVLDAIEKLEKNEHRREHLKQKFADKVAHEGRVRSLFFAGILPLIILVAYLMILIAELNLDTLLRFLGHTGLVLAICLVLYILIFLILNKMWQANVFKKARAHVEHKWMKKLENQEILINSDDKTVLSEEIFSPGRIDEKYMSRATVSQLAHYMESHQAVFLEEAVYMLEMDMQGSKDKKELAEQSIVQMAREKCDKPFLVDCLSIPKS
jgi:hypothetical protein